MVLEGRVSKREIDEVNCFDAQYPIDISYHNGSCTMLFHKHVYLQHSTTLHNNPLLAFYLMNDIQFAKTNTNKKNWLILFRNFDDLIKLSI